MTGAAAAPAVTWWGHSSMTLELGATRVVTDPLLTPRLFHLRRAVPEPPDRATEADLLLVSHLHHDHLHLPSLHRFDASVPLVVPRGAPGRVRGLAGRSVVEVAPGETVELAGVRVEVLGATHDGSRDKLRGRDAAPPALGFRIDDGTTSVWYPGDTGVRADFAEVDPVDLAAVPIGGWGPTLGEEHLDPEQAAEAVAAVGARWALAVHYGTYWPVGLQRLHPANHRRLFVTPPQRFRRALSDRSPGTTALTPAIGDRVALAAAR